MKNKIITTLTILLVSILFCAACGGDSASATSIHLMKKEGNVRVEDSKGKSLSPEENMGLYDGYSMETRQESYAWINLDSVKLTKMDSDSEIAIQKDGTSLEIQVNSGNLYFNITEPLKEDESLDIRTSTMSVGIRGTCGWISLTDSSRMTVYILEGTVECSVIESSGERKIVSVSSGEMAELLLSEDGTAAITVVPFTESDILSFVLEELAGDDKLCQKIQDASGLDILTFLETWDREPSVSDGSVTEDTESENPVADLQGDNSTEELVAMPEDHAMDWQDDNLEAAMRGITGIHDRDIMLSDIWERDSLNLSTKGIVNINALGELINLHSLWLNDNQVSDVSALGNLTNLEILTLSINQISDISALGNLTNLTHLVLEVNQISDISALKNLTNLKELNLLDNQISDISVLKNLIGLENLSLQMNQLNDISTLKELGNLKILVLVDNQISDISALGNLTNLETLFLENNQISDISVLGNLINLTSLSLSNNQISDVSALGSLVNLEHLYLSNNQISDISAMSSLKKLQYLDVRGNQVNDYLPMKFVPMFYH